jgi:hypothetical protein
VSNLTICDLDIQNTKKVVQYERALFRAFYGIKGSAMDLFWNIDKKNRRISAKIPYSDQKIFIADLDDEVIAGVAINLNISALLQLEMLGFSIDKAEPFIAEGLALFNTQTFPGSESVIIKLRDYMDKKVDEFHIRKVYGTCSERLLRGYKILGWKVLDEKVINGAPKFLIEKVFI